MDQASQKPRNDSRQREQKRNDLKRLRLLFPNEPHAQSRLLTRAVRTTPVSFLSFSSNVLGSLSDKSKAVWSRSFCSDESTTNHGVCHGENNSSDTSGRTWPWQRHKANLQVNRHLQRCWHVFISDADRSRFGLLQTSEHALHHVSRTKDWASVSAVQFSSFKIPKASMS